MAREIKFRGYNRKNKQWPYGFCLQNRGAHFVAPDEFATGKSLDDYEVDSETVGQFTGCYDKNHNRIFEGDIVECVSWNEYFSNGDGPMKPFRRRMYVEFRNGGFKMIEPMPSPMKDNVWDIIYNGDIVVVGNIHDDM